MNKEIMNGKKTIEEIKKEIEIKKLAIQKWKETIWFGRLTLKDRFKNLDYYEFGIFDNNGLTVYLETPYGICTDRLNYKTKNIIKRNVYTINIDWDKYLKEIVDAINKHIGDLEKEIEELKKECDILN